MSGKNTFFLEINAENDIFLKYSVKSPQKGALTHFLSTFASMKTLTDTEYIHALIAEGEHQQQDFKFEISDARKIAKTLSAFANTDVENCLSE